VSAPTGALDSRCTTAELWAMAGRFVSWLERVGYAGYDPYDIWGTRYGRVARRLYYRKHPLGLLLTAPVIAMEIVCPWLRRVFVRKNRFPTADAQLALAFINAYEVSLRTGVGEPLPTGGRTADFWLGKAKELGDDLLTQSVSGYSGLCWGYPFDWQNVGGLMKKGTPHITATPYCYEVFARLFDLTGEEYYAAVARSVATFVFADLNDTPTGTGAAAASYTPFDHSKVVNASAYRAFVLFDAARRFHDEGYRAKASQNLRFILDAQRDDGSWLYAIDSPAEAFIDHFHTCFVLKNLHKINRHLQSAEVARAVIRGYQWYRRALFDEDGTPRLFAIAPRLQLVELEMYNVAEAVGLGVLLRHDIPEAFDLAETLAARFVRRWQLPAGHWITRTYVGGITHRLPFIRWPQSQLFLGLTHLLAAREQIQRKGIRTMTSRTGKGANSLRYVLVTAARNEAEFIELTIRSVVAQSVRPVKWVIASDGSTDGTDEIIRSYARDYPWIELVQMPARRERHFAGKAHAFNAGLARLGALDYDVIGNLDADVSFDEGYFAFLLARLAEDPSLGVVGTAFADTSLHYNYRFVSLEHVAGPLQVFRRTCLEDIGGYVASPSGGVDHIAVITARMKGWKTRTFPDKVYRHHRQMGTAARGLVMARFKSGAVDYLLGGHPIWELFRSIYQTTKPPYVVGGLALLAGYISAGARGVPRPVPRELVQFRRREQMHRLKNLFAGRTAA